MDTDKYEEVMASAREWGWQKGTDAAADVARDLWGPPDGQSGWGASGAAEYLNETDRGSCVFDSVVPTPDLSGEFADGLTPNVLAYETGLYAVCTDEELTDFGLAELCETYEQAFTEAAIERLRSDAVSVLSSWATAAFARWNAIERREEV